MLMEKSTLLRALLVQQFPKLAEMSSHGALYLLLSHGSSGSLSLPLSLPRPPPHFPRSSSLPSRAMAIPRSSLNLQTQQGSKCRAEQGALYVGNLHSLEIIINANTLKRVGYYMMITFSFLPDIAALLTVAWCSEGLGEGGCSCSTPGSLPGLGGGATVVLGSGVSEQETGAFSSALCDALALSSGLLLLKCTWKGRKSI